MGPRAFALRDFVSRMPRMVLLELATQAVRGSSPSVRAALTPGYVVLTSAVKEPFPLAGLVTSLLFPEGHGEDAEFAAAGAASPKAGLTLQGQDRNAYRILRDLGGAGALQRLNRETQSFDLLTADSQEMTQLLRSGAGLPTRTTFERLFTLASSQLMSQRPPPSEGRGKATAQQSTKTSMGRGSEAQRKIAELERELELATKVEQMQFQQDGLASQMFTLESKLGGTDGLRKALDDAERAYANAPTHESLNLPRDIVARCERYGAVVQRRDDALARLAADREAEQQSQPAGLEPLYKDTRFIAGAGIGAAALVGGALLEGAGRYVALLDVPAFGFAALVALQWVDELRGSQRVGRKGALLEAREKKILADFETESQPIRAAMSALGVDTAQDVIELLERRRLLAEKVEDFRRQLAEAEADPDYAQARQRHTALKAQSEALTAKLQEQSGGYIRDVREVERELERARAALSPAPQVAEAAEPVTEVIRLEDPSPTLLSAAADLINTDVPTIAALVKDRCTQYLAALCDRRYSGVTFDVNGAARLTTASGTVGAAELPARDADLFFVSLRLTLVEKLSAKTKLPLLIDDSLRVIDPAKVPLLARMLKHLGTLTQVVQVTDDAALTAMADTKVTL